LTIVNGNRGISALYNRLAHGTAIRRDRDSVVEPAQRGLSQTISIPTGAIPNSLPGSTPSHAITASTRSSRVPPSPKTSTAARPPVCASSRQPGRVPLRAQTETRPGFWGQCPIARVARYSSATPRQSSRRHRTAQPTRHKGWF